MPLRSHTFLRPALAVLATVVGLLLGEGSMRAMGLGNPLLDDDVQFNWTPQPPFRRSQDPVIEVELSPGFAGAMEYRRATDGALVQRIAVRISPQGLRGPDPGPAPDAGGQRILGLGDSLTFGSGVAEAQTYLSVAQAELARVRPAQVLNAGVPTWNLAQEVRWMATSGLALAPDVVVLGFFVNDLEPKKYPDPDNVMPPFTYRKPPWARPEGGLRRHSFLANHVLRVIERRRVAAEALGQIGDYRAHLRSLVGQPAVRQDLARDLGSLRQSCTRLEARCIVLLIPLLEIIHEDPMSDLLGQVGRAATSQGLEVMDMTPVLQGMTLPELLVLPADPHPSPAAHARMGRALAQRLSSPAPPP